MDGQTQTDRQTKPKRGERRTDLKRQRRTERGRYGRDMQMQTDRETKTDKRIKRIIQANCDGSFILKGQLTFLS